MIFVGESGRRAPEAAYCDIEDDELDPTELEPGRLMICLGSVEGRSMAVKGAETVVTGKHKGLRYITANGFKRLAVRITGRQRCRTLILESRPDEDPDEFIYDPFYIRGRFEVVAEIKNVRRAVETWRAFGKT